MKKKRISGYASWSLTIGIFSILFSIILGFIGLIIGIIGIFLSRKAVKDINEKDIGGKRTATAGLTCSVIGMVLPIIFVILGVTSFNSAPHL